MKRRLDKLQFKSICHNPFDLSIIYAFLYWIKIQAHWLQGD